MKKVHILFLFLVVTLLFFYPIFKGHIPFPGDLLVSSTPYNTYSFLGYAPGGVPNKAQGPDVMHELFPWKFFVIDSLKRGEIPFWTPYNFSGNTLMANFQSGTFYPLNIIFFTTSFLNAWTIFIAIAPLLASVFTFLFLRLLNFSKWASFFGGIVFSFSSYMVVWMEYGNITHALMWLPLILYFTEKYLQNYKWQNVLFLTLSLWLSFLAGYIQGFFYIIVFSFIYFAAKISFFDKKNLKKKIVFLAAIIFPVLLSLFQLLPTLSLFTMSSRGSYTLQQITELLNPWWYTITTFVPDFFGNPAARNSWFSGTYIERVSFFGVIPLLLALSALFSPKKKIHSTSSGQEIKIFAALFIISFFLSLDLFLTRFFYLLPIPILSTTVPTRILSIFVFCGAILAAYGLDLFIQNKQKKQFIIVSLTSIIFILIAWASVFILSKDNPNLLIAKRNLILPTFWIFIFLFIILFRYSKFFKHIKYSLVIILFILFAGTIADLFYFFHKITPFSPREFVFPKTSVINYLQNNAGINRYWGYGSGYISSNFQTLDKTFSPEGFDALHLKLYTEFISASNNGKISEVVSRDNANIAPGYGTGELRSNPFRQKALNILGVKYVLHKNEILIDDKEYKPDIATFDEKEYRLVWQEKPWQIYENLSVTPRFFLTNKYSVSDDKDKTIEKIYSKIFDEKNELVLAKDPNIGESNLTKKSAKLLNYSPNKVTIQSDSDADSLLFLSDTYSTDWHAAVDGQEQEVLRANYAFRAVKVPSGKHEVTFFYKDKAFEIGIVFSAIAAGAFIIFLLLIKKKKI